MTGSSLVIDGGKRSISNIF